MGSGSTSFRSTRFDQGMRILELIQGLGHGGAEIALLRRLRSSPAGIQTVLLVTRPGPVEQSSASLGPGVQIVQRHLRWTDRAWMERLLMTRRIDIIVSHSPRDNLKLLAWNIDARCPVVVVAHHEMAANSRLFDIPARHALRMLNSRASLHVAVSGPAAQGAQCAGARRTEVHLLGGDVSPNATAEAVWPSDARLRWMTLSRLVWFKNIPTLIEAVGLRREELRRAGVHLAIVGSGPQEGTIAQTIARHGVDDLVSMHQGLADPGGLLRQADALINSSRTEGGPITLFEALLAGLNVLSTPTGAAEAALHGDAGSVIAAGRTAAELGEALTQLARLGPLTPEVRAARAQAGARWRSSARGAIFYQLLESVDRGRPTASDA